MAGLVAGAVSMALGEYASVSSQRDSQRAQIAQEERELAASPEAELTELTALYEAKGLSAATARTVATELTSHGALAAHLDAELHIDPADIPSPVQAAVASALSFTVGALLPLLAILLPPATARVPVTFAAVLIALALTGALNTGPSSGAAATRPPTAPPSCSTWRLLLAVSRSVMPDPPKSAPRHRKVPDRQKPAARDRGWLNNRQWESCPTITAAEPSESNRAAKTSQSCAAPP